MKWTGLTRQVIVWTSMPWHDPCKGGLTSAVKALFMQNILISVTTSGRFCLKARENIALQKLDQDDAERIVRHKPYTSQGLLRTELLLFGKLLAFFGFALRQAACPVSLTPSGVTNTCRRCTVSVSDPRSLLQLSTATMSRMLQLSRFFRCS